MERSVVYVYDITCSILSFHISHNNVASLLLLGVNGSLEDGVENDVVREAHPFTVDSSMAAG